MADDFVSLADLILINDQNLADLNVTDLLDDAPLLAALAAQPASNGTEHKYLKETGAPVVGFRAANAGRDMDSSDDTLVTITLKILDCSFVVDKAIADAYQRGGAAALIARELRRAVKAGFFGAEKQIINGVNADAGGFVGLVDATTLDALADTMVTNAGGSTALSSVFLIRSGDDDCSIVAGDEGKLTVGDSIAQMVLGSNSKLMPAYATPVSGWLGLQIGSARSVGRIANIDASTHKLTDALLYSALSNFPASRQPTHIAMNRRSREQLRASRTATNATGTPAPVPTEVEGLPIVCTDAILNTETAVA